MTLQFPFAVIDFEASSLSDERSYPIEVGVAVAQTAEAPIVLWSSLVRPTSDWLANGHWSVKSQAVHQITKDDLNHARAPRDLAEELNRAAVSISSWWCDGGEYDAHWFKRLFDAARMTPAFSVSDVSALLGSNKSKRRFSDALAQSPAPHRAGPDAARLCLAILDAHGISNDRPMRVVDDARQLSSARSN